MHNARQRFEIVVVGAGPAGLAAAVTAAEAGRQVGLVSDAPWLGGQIWHHAGERAGGSEWLTRARHPGIHRLPSTTIIGVLGGRELLAETAQGPLTLGYEKLVLANGARELFLPFPGWTLPGVMGPGGAQALAKGGWPVAGKRVVVAGSGPLLWAAADGLRAHGARVLCVLEQSPFSRVAGLGLGLARHPGKLVQAAGIRWRLGLTRFRYGAWVTAAGGDSELRSVTWTAGEREQAIECELLACGYGLTPNTEIALALGCHLESGFVRTSEGQSTTVKDVFAAGELTGIGGAEKAVVEGQLAGMAVSDERRGSAELEKAKQKWEAFRRNLAEAYRLRPELMKLAGPETVVCRCEDVRCGKLREFDSWRAAKLLSRCGMGPCQGRLCGAATREIFGWGPDTVRPPILPVRLDSLVRAKDPETQRRVIGN